MIPRYRLTTPTSTAHGGRQGHPDEQHADRELGNPRGTNVNVARPRSVDSELGVDRPGQVHRDVAGPDPLADLGGAGQRDRAEQPWPSQT